MFIAFDFSNAGVFRRVIRLFVSVLQFFVLNFEYVYLYGFVCCNPCIITLTCFVYLACSSNFINRVKLYTIVIKMECLAISETHFSILCFFSYNTSYRSRICMTFPFVSLDDHAEGLIL